MPHTLRFVATFAIAAILLGPGQAQTFKAPAGDRAAAMRLGAESVLPGGRLITPLGRQHVTAAYPLDVAVSPKGERVAVAGRSNGLAALSVFNRARPALRRERLESDKAEPENNAPGAAGRAFRGIVFDGTNRICFSEGASGNARLVDARNGETLRQYRLNQGDFRNSDAAGLALDARRKRLYVVDRANGRLVVFDFRTARVVGSAGIGPFPSHIALAMGGERAFITGSPASDSSEPAVLTAVDLSGGAPRVLKHIPIGSRQEENPGPNELAGVLSANGAVYATNHRDDTVYVIDPLALEVSSEIPLRIAGLEGLRGIEPSGMAFDGVRQRLYVAERGINAVAVIDIVHRRLLGHLPTGWKPAAVALHGNDLYVVNESGQGTGPNATAEGALPARTISELERGTLAEIVLAEAGNLEAHTARVMANNGFVPSQEPLSPLPSAIEHVVLILKGNRSFDEIYGDLQRAANGPVEAAPALARFGNLGFAQRERGGLAPRGELRDVPVTPNHHGVAEEFAFSDNFYRAFDGHALTPVDEAWDLALWPHLRRHGVSYLDFRAPLSAHSNSLAMNGSSRPAGEGSSDHRDARNLHFRRDTGVPDQLRADSFIHEIEENYRKSGRDLPRLLLLRLPNDRMGVPRPEDGYPFRASYVADNDLALGRVVEYLSQSPWWSRMAVLAVEENSGSGLDHVDAHRSILLVAGPYVRRNYVSHRNADFSAVLKMVLRIFRIPPMNLGDATAADLGDCLNPVFDQRAFNSHGVKPELFDPERAKLRFAARGGVFEEESGSRERNQAERGP